jgi:hypothetical protein
VKEANRAGYDENHDVRGVTGQEGNIVKFDVRQTQ